LLIIRTPPVGTPATNRACTPRKGKSIVETGVAAVRQPQNGRPVSPSRRLLRFHLGGVGLHYHLRLLLRQWHLHRCRFVFSVCCIYCYNCTPRRPRGQVHARLPSGASDLHRNGGPDAIAAGWVGRTSGIFPTRVWVGISNKCYNGVCVFAPLVGGKDRCTGRQTTSRKHRRCGATGVCRSGRRSPLLTGAASSARILASQIQSQQLTTVGLAGEGSFP
jgi:hypothetical protein